MFRQLRHQGTQTLQTLSLITHPQILWQLKILNLKLITQVIQVREMILVFCSFFLLTSYVSIIAPWICYCSEFFIWTLITVCFWWLTATNNTPVVINHEIRLHDINTLDWDDLLVQTDLDNQSAPIAGITYSRVRHILKRYPNIRVCSLRAIGQC